MSEGNLQVFPLKTGGFESKYWYNANFNPYGNPYVGDCMVRAVSAALMMKYKSVCKRLGVGVKVGFGAKTKGISPADLQVFSEFLQPIELPSAMTVREFVEKCGRSDSLQYGIYVVCTDTHAIYVCAKTASKKYFIDTWDSSGKNVEVAFRVVKQVDSGSSERLTLSEFRKIQEYYSDPEVQAKFQKLAGKI